MRGKFEGREIQLPSRQWDERVSANRYLLSDVILSAVTKEHRVKAMLHPSFCACEYKVKLNILTFSRLKINLPFTVIAPPASLDCKGYVGNVQDMISDYKKRRGMFLILNMKEEDAKMILDNTVAVGKTLPTCIFRNKIENFDHYLASLRSSYRRRINTALAKGRQLDITRIRNAAFSPELHEFYLEVLRNSQFPLEELPLNFFRQSDCDIDVFYHESRPVAFVMHTINDDVMSFVFGGMNYQYRDEYDLYYNMLLHMLKIGIKNQVKVIDLGQTAENTKCRLGCELEERYMAAFCRNRFVSMLLCHFAPLLAYDQEQIHYNVFNGK
jgi:hypothetical protein